ncbi:MAG: hypothetical protein JEZ06_19680 [Anaerolineaceae bacterium]|nr:hypothetical protein [Anaerolineaceae bacterium]
MKQYFLGIDIGGSKSHAMIADERGNALGFGSTGSGNWEYIGFETYQTRLKEITNQALLQAGLHIEQISGAGYGISGFDWPSQIKEHEEVVQNTGLKAPFKIVNDALLGILAGTEEGWGISIVAGTGNNCRGLNPDHTREGRLVGGEEWSWEFGGAVDVVRKAMQYVSREWSQRGPASSLTHPFIKAKGAKDLDDLIEGLYVKRYEFNRSDVLMVFELAANGNPDALHVVQWIGDQLGDLAVGVIRQLEFEDLTFDTVLIGSLWQGSPIMAERAAACIHQIAPKARLKPINVSPVIGAVLLGMQQTGLDYLAIRKHLLKTGESLIPQPGPQHPNE